MSLVIHLDRDILVLILKPFCDKKNFEIFVIKLCVWVNGNSRKKEKGACDVNATIQRKKVWTYF